MKKEELFEAVGQVGEDLIEGCAQQKTTKKSRPWLRAAAAVLAVCILFAGAWRLDDGLSANAVDLMADIRPNPVSADVDLTGDNAVAVTDFALRLLRQTMADRDAANDNILISPYSVLTALSMTANGAAGQTRSQMEAVLGLPLEELNAYLRAYTDQLPSGGNYRVHTANSIWLKDDPLLHIEESFLQTNADYYGAGVYKAPFDSTTVSDINHWVNENTDGMIPSILNEIPQDAVLYLINSLSFEAKWAEQYESDDVAADIFQKEDKTRQNVDMMYSSESAFLRDEHAVGFLKYYKDDAYAFVGLLPEEGMTVEEYVSGLTGESLRTMLTSAGTGENFRVGIPKFKGTDQTDLVKVLEAMGMTDAFDAQNADFSAMGSYGTQGLYIGQARHDTFIEVDEQGTKAAAVTFFGANGTAAAPAVEPVILDRPFVYLIVDTDTMLPLFIGTEMDILAE